MSKPLARLGEMSFEVGRMRPWGPLRKRAQSAKCVHKVYVKIANCLKNITLSVEWAHFNPRHAGPLDFPPPAGGGGAFERPPPHDLGSWSP